MVKNLVTEIPVFDIIYYLYCLMLHIIFDPYHIL